MLRPFFLLLLSASLSWTLQGQITAERQSMSEGVYEGLQIRIPDLDDKTVGDVWGNFTKDYYDARSRYDRRSQEYQAEGAEIPAIGQGENVNLYMTASEVNNGTLVTVWFKFGDAYVSHDQFPDRYLEAEKVMMQFALECGKEKTRQDIDQMEKDLRDMERDLDRLAREKERYEQDIKKAEEAIRQAQASIEENVQAQGAAQEQIKQQQELIEATRRKLNDL